MGLGRASEWPRKGFGRGFRAMCKGAMVMHGHGNGLHVAEQSAVLMAQFSCCVLCLAKERISMAHIHDISPCQGKYFSCLPASSACMSRKCVCKKTGVTLAQGHILLHWQRKYSEITRQHAAGRESTGQRIHVRGVQAREDRGPGLEAGIVWHVKHCTMATNRHKRACRAVSTAAGTASGT